MALFKTKNSLNSEMTNLKIPNHIAIIMDGNGRWAKKRFMPRAAGHKAGMNTVKRVTKTASDLGVKVLTLYAFSTENWTRPNDEVSFLMQLPIDFFNEFVPDLVKNNIRVKVMGDINRLPAGTQKAVERAIRQTSDNTGMVLNFALNYGGQLEIIEATKILAQRVADGLLSPDEINADMFANVLNTSDLGDLAAPDLMIRTSGELRLSNFMPYQAAYSELYFTDVLWPDYTAEDLNQAISAYTLRDRRFGGLTQNSESES
ncbi:isoprenyl transferase [Leuconostoc carnosum]|uniref:Isoprenyl transferase n=2 Tax=Leuconostoc carnosum TaxID=1252 RepID=K0DE76_LEUCJ|nr:MULTISPECIES: isoprenyl transferase [Leuconostoc]AFT81887.1 undecaprenyl diphosphate synthase [Leuconostoc carnosum JB16]KAA8325437.1 isoprenyl transferase [Leuconostoc carnosum]KAA8328467.1 isoprenyl transferase [Leuconostoc carnosum]KAA8359660.1 isoprenyl transferase [Leuconostoc carnosum]KAA8365234.1 isoprenyl transferase [Leuconostoc carnosum]